jgi:hypothetical protein
MNPWRCGHGFSLKKETQEREQNIMPEPILERFTPENTTILMVDYSVGFLNSFRSHTINDHLQATVALAQTALGFHTGFVVNLGRGQTPYPQLVQALGDHPVIYRGGEYNALDNPDVPAAAARWCWSGRSPGASGSAGKRCTPRPRPA